MKIITNGYTGIEVSDSAGPHGNCVMRSPESESESGFLNLISGSESGFSESDFSGSESRFLSLKKFESESESGFLI